MRKMKKLLRFYPTIILFSLFSFCSLGQENKNLNMTELKSGQIWKYNNRKGENKSRVIILKVEDYGKKGQIVHIAVNGLKIKNKNVKGGITREISHLPFDKESIKSSLKELESETDKIPEFIDGYNKWKKAFENDEAGVFTSEIKYAVEFVDKSINK